jgi:hypothetical protein
LPVTFSAPSERASGLPTTRYSAAFFIPQPR